MPDETYNVKLIGQAGESLDAAFDLDPDQDPCTLRLRYSGGELTATEEDFFEALCTIRRQLEGVGLRPDCYGASRDVYPSPMSRGMGGGLKAYKLRMGGQAQMADLVFIFDRGLDTEPVTVGEQEEYYRRWVKSLAP